MFRIKRLFFVCIVLWAFLFPGQLWCGGELAFLSHSTTGLRDALISQQESFSGEKSVAEGNGAVRFSKKLTKKQIKELALSATQNPDSKKVMLGRYIENSDSSYNVKAGTEYTFFELRNWDEIYRQTGFEYDQMWRICERFMKNQMKHGKDFYFSHDPNDPKGRGFSMEVSYLKKEKKRIRFIRTGDLWKAVW